MNALEQFLQAEVKDTRDLINTEHNSHKVAYYTGMNQLTDALLQYIRYNPNMTNTLIDKYLEGMAVELSNIRTHVKHG